MGAIKQLNADLIEEAGRFLNAESQLFPPHGEELALLHTQIHQILQPRQRASTPREDQLSIL